MFDAVGTLIYARPPVAQVYAAVGRRFGSRLTEAEVTTRFEAIFRQAEAEDFAGDLKTSEWAEQQRWRRIVEKVLDDVTDPEECFRELFEHFARPTAWCCFPDVQDVFGPILSRGVRVAIASNFDSRLLEIVGQLEPLCLCDRVLVSSQIGYRKPHEQFFRAVVSPLGGEASELVYVGDDRRNDLEGAEQAGMRAVLLDRHGGQAGAIGSLVELLEWMDSK